MTGQYYADILHKLRSAIVKKLTGMVTRGVLLLHDNAPVHKSRVVHAALLRDCGFKQLDHSPYSPDLAPSDYYLFPNLKKHLKGARLEDLNSVKVPPNSSSRNEKIAFIFRVSEAWRTNKVDVLELRGTILKNEISFRFISILIMPELQNFLIAPRTFGSLLVKKRNIANI